FVETVVADRFHHRKAGVGVHGLFFTSTIDNDNLGHRLRLRSGTESAPLAPGFGKPVCAKGWNARGFDCRCHCHRARSHRRAFAPDCDRAWPRRLSGTAHPRHRLSHLAAHHRRPAGQRFGGGVGSGQAGGAAGRRHAAARSARRRFRRAARSR
ncbi:hypothetical protein OY671_011456, partial [Metschnikowia pulcherrima]